MPPIVTSAEIGRPAAEVFACATDPSRFSEWQRGVIDGHMERPGGCRRRAGRGGHVRDDAAHRRRQPPGRSELVDIDPPRLWGVRGIDGPIRGPAAGVHGRPASTVQAHWDELDDQCQLLLSLRFYGNMTQAEIGNRLGVSQMQVSRLLRSTLDYLRDRLTGPPADALGTSSDA